MSKPDFNPEPWTIFRVVDAYVKGQEKEKSIHTLYINRKDYQRQFVWTKQDESRLYKSLLKNWSTPSIVLLERKNDANHTYYEVVDGQQRITTFTKILRPDLFEPNNKISKPNIKPEDQINFDIDHSNINNIRIPVMIIKSENEKIAQEYYMQINQFGKKLNNQELRWGKYNKFDAFKLIDKIFSSENFLNNFVPQNDKVKIINWNSSRKKHEEEIIILYRIWNSFTYPNNELTNKFTTDYKTELDNFFNTYTLDETKIDLFIKKLISFQEKFNKFITLSEKNHHFQKLFYFIIFFVGNIEGYIKFDGDSINKLCNFSEDVWFIDKTIEKEDDFTKKDTKKLKNKNFSRAKRDRFVPARSSTKSSRNQSYKILIEYLGEI